jgi:glycosyltransferase involved in cell wall biosynthesis
MSKRGHTIDYFIEQPGPSLLPGTKRMKQSASRDAFGRGLSIAAHLKGICRQREYDFLLTAATAGWCLSAFRRWFLAPKTRVLSWYGGASAMLDFTVRRKALSRWTEKKALETQDAFFFTDTKAPIELIEEHPHAEHGKMLYLPNGVASSYYFPERYRNQESLLSPTRLLVCGPWTRRHQVVTNTLTHLSEHHPELRLSVLKPGLSSAQVLSDFPLQVQSSVQILAAGGLTLPSPAEAARIESACIAAYRQHDVYLQLAPEEGGVPLALLEAMAAALPVIAEDAPGIRDVLRHYENGLIVPGQSAELQATEAWEHSIAHLLENPALAKTLGEAAYEDVSRYYTWRQISDVFEARLLQLLENPVQNPAG